MSTHNIGFYEDLTKIIFQLSSNTHLISSSVTEIFDLSTMFFERQHTNSKVLQGVSWFQDGFTLVVFLFSSTYNTPRRTVSVSGKLHFM